MATLGRQSAIRILRSSLYTEDIIIRAEMPGKRNEYGEYEPGRKMTFDLKASQEPIDPESLSQFRNVLLEGNRIVDARFFYICTLDPDLAKALRTGQGSQTRRDVIEYQGICYLIRRVADYSAHGHLEILATREEGQDD